MDRLNRRAFLLGASALAATRAIPAVAAGGDRWSAQQAADWYRQQPWLVGSNYIPATAINQLEMWQADTFDPGRIDLELGWAQGLGMNTMRVFLHDLLWQQDSAGFGQRIDSFLDIADSHRIRPVFVLFDSCWDPFPRLGPQHPPIPGVHNSGWVQSPGAEALQDPASTRSCASTWRASSAPSQTTIASSPGTYGTSPTTRTTGATGR